MEKKPTNVHFNLRVRVKKSKFVREKKEILQTLISLKCRENTINRQKKRKIGS